MKYYNKFLIVIDMQNDFIDGSLGTKEAQKIVPSVVERIKQAREDGWEICYTMDTHYEDYMKTQEGKKLPVPHCIVGTEGYELHPDVKEALLRCNAYGYTKPTFGSVEMADNIFSDIRNCDIPENNVIIEIIGLCTDICVVSNAILLKAYLPEAQISVNASCCAGVTPELHEEALKVMKSCQINVIGE